MFRKGTSPVYMADTGGSGTPAEEPAAPASGTPSPAPAAGSPAPSPSPADSGTPSPAPAPAPTPSPAPAPSPAPDPKAGDPPAYKIPDAYKDKPWASKIKSEDDLWKQLDNTQTLVGKKMIVPDLTKATETEREEYFAQTRPASVDAYEFGAEIDPNMKKGIGESLMKNGVSAFQANNIIKDYQAGEQALLAEQYSPDGMKAAMEASFGKDWEKVTGTARNVMVSNGLLSADDNKMLDNLPNPYIALVYRAIGNVVQKYGIKESAAHVDAPGAGHTPPDIATVRTALRNEIGALRYKPHTAGDKQVLIDKLNATYETKGA